MSNAITVLSHGAGQDSTTIMYLAALDPEFRAKYINGHLLAICSDTGNEHDETYLHIDQIVKPFCEQHNIEFHHLTADRGYHRGNWVSLQSFYQAKNAIGSVAYPKTCTDNLKVQPIYRFLNDWLGKRHGYPTDRKQAIYQHAERHGKIRVLIGIAADEESRACSTTEGQPVWMARNVEKVYPLLEMGWNRARCQEYIRSLGQPVPPPSNCIFCPFKSDLEILWTARNMPDRFEFWVELERRKIAANTHVARNLGVKGTKLLPQVLAEAEVKYATWTPAQINDYRMSHGHCVKSRY